MKNLKTILLSIFLIGVFNVGYSQCPSIINASKNMYQDRSVDLYVNPSFDLKKITDEGVDFDVEAGAKLGALVLYGFYGNHNAVDYTNYGGGIDYQLINGYLVDIYAGVNVGGIDTPTNLTVNEVSYFAYAVRAKTLYEMTNRVGLTLVGQYQQRPDMPNTDGIFELSAGIQIKLN